jgi:hypothetical protein
VVRTLNLTDKDFDGVRQPNPSRMTLRSLPMRRLTSEGALETRREGREGREGRPWSEHTNLKRSTLEWQCNFTQSRDHIVVAVAVAELWMSPWWRRRIISVGLGPSSVGRKVRESFELTTGTSVEQKSNENNALGKIQILSMPPLCLHSRNTHPTPPQQRIDKIDLVVRMIALLEAVVALDTGASSVVSALTIGDMSAQCHTPFFKGSPQRSCGRRHEASTVERSCVNYPISPSAVLKTAQVRIFHQLPPPSPQRVS